MGSTGCTIRSSTVRYTHDPIQHGPIHARSDTRMVRYTHGPIQARSDTRMVRYTHGPIHARSDTRTVRTRARRGARTRRFADGGKLRVRTRARRSHSRPGRTSRFPFRAGESEIVPVDRGKTRTSAGASTPRIGRRRLRTGFPAASGTDGGRQLRGRLRPAPAGDGRGGAGRPASRAAPPLDAHRLDRRRHVAMRFRGRLRPAPAGDGRGGAGDAQLRGRLRRSTRTASTAAATPRCGNARRCGTMSFRGPSGGAAGGDWRAGPGGPIRRT